VFPESFIEYNMNMTLRGIWKCLKKSVNFFLLASIMDTAFWNH